MPKAKRVRAEPGHIEPSIENVVEFEVGADFVHVSPSDQKLYQIINTDDGSMVTMTGAHARRLYGPADWKEIKAGGVPHLVVTEVIPPHAPFKRFVRRWGGEVIGNEYRLQLRDRTLTIEHRPEPPAGEGRYQLLEYRADEFSDPELQQAFQSDSLSDFFQIVKQIAAISLPFHG